MINKSTPLAKVLPLAPPCSCEKCRYGCTIGSGCLTGDDLDKLAKHLQMSKEEVKEKYLEEVTIFNTSMLRPKTKGKPLGACIFYDQQKGCTVHEAKPLECKTASGCSPHGHDLSIWFRLRHCVNVKDPESIRQWKTYIETGGKTIPGGEIEALLSKAEQRKIASFEDVEKTLKEKIAMKPSYFREKERNI